MPFFISLTLILAIFFIIYNFSGDKGLLKKKQKKDGDFSEKK